MTRLRATRISPAGRAWLEEFTQARPLHVFDHVCNLVNGEGVVLSLQSEPVPPSPVSISLNTDPVFRKEAGGFPAWINRDSEVRLKGGRLILGQLEVEWEGAETWEPAPPWDLLRDDVERWKQRAVELVPLLLAEAPANSLVPLLAPQDSEAGTAKGGPLAERILAAARPAAEALQRALAQADLEGLEAAAGRLAGLGGGLTPSGDDYLMGVMHALWATEVEGEARRISERMAKAAADRTGPLSATWLLAAGTGEATGSWHQLLADLREGGQQALTNTARRIMRIGHSSGADGLAGFCQTLIEQ